MQIHFIILKCEEGQSFLLTLPGQTMGRGNGVIWEMDEGSCRNSWIVKKNFKEN